ncbi:uncharacterized protein L199_000531 [Kwoniella botswanensis]|uniref:uncharacterized protein n=1 Tax=Kwoniella botswanensis TaxID=1268659 RepID=UPI00315DF202
MMGPDKPTIMIMTRVDEDKANGSRHRLYRFFEPDGTVLEPNHPIVGSIQARWYNTFLKHESSQNPLSLYYTSAYQRKFTDDRNTADKEFNRFMRGMAADLNGHSEFPFDLHVLDDEENKRFRETIKPASVLTSTSSSEAASTPTVGVERAEHDEISTEVSDRIQVGWWSAVASKDGDTLVWNDHALGEAGQGGGQQYNA